MIAFHLPYNVLGKSWAIRALYALPSSVDLSSALEKGNLE